MVMVGPGMISCLTCNSNFVVFENAVVEKMESLEELYLIAD